MEDPALEAAIVTALPLELAPVTARWGVGRPEPGRIYRGVSPGGRRLAAVCTGPGTIDAALGITSLLERVNPPVVFAGGIAGGIVAGAGTVVLARSVGFYDVDLTGLGIPAGVLHRGAAPNLEAASPNRAVSQSLLEEALLSAQISTPEDIPLVVGTGLILSGDCFLDARLWQELPRVWQERIAGAEAVDMESAAWGTVLHRAGVPWSILRYISDEVSGDRRLPFPAACAAAGEILTVYADFFLSHPDRS